MADYLIPLDSKWFRRLRELTHHITMASAFTQYHRQKKVEFEKFIEDRSYIPVIKRRKHKRKELLQRIDSLMTFKNELTTKEDNAIVKSVYTAKIDEEVARLQMIIAAIHGDMISFKQATEFVYGTPSPRIYAHTIAQLHADTQKLLSLSKEPVQSAAQAFLSKLPEITYRSDIVTPDKETITKVFTFFREKMELLLSGITGIEEDLRDWSGTELRDVFSKSLRAIELFDWNAVTSKSHYYLSVSGETKEVRVPAKRRIPHQRLLALLAHEVGVHVVRRINGSSSPLLLLGTGLDHYQPGEEGVATLLEEATLGTFHLLVRPERYLAIGAVYGLSGRPYSFAEVFELLESYYYLQEIQTRKSKIVTRRVAQRLAWEACMRVFRGADFGTPGVCSTKDIIYQDGNIQIWELIQNNPKEVQRFLCGKYDPANARHRDILTTLGITGSEDLLDTLS